MAETLTPQAGTPAGQEPAGTTATTATIETPAQPAGTGAQDVSSLPEWAQKELRDTRADAAANRIAAKDRNALATRLKTIEDAQLSEQEKITQRAQELEKQATSTAAELRQERAHREVERTARRLNIVDEETALALIQGKIEFNDAGQPSNIETLLKDLIKSKPFLLQGAAPPAGNPGNPAGARGGTLTLETIKGMTREQIEARWDDVQAAMKGSR